MTLGQRIQQKRKQQGHSMRALADLAGVSASTICRTEGGGTCSVEALVAIAKALDTTVGWLVGEVDSEPGGLQWSDRLGLEHTQDCYQTLSEAIRWALAMGYSEKQVSDHVATLALFKRLDIHQ